ncbi:unnamed protein product [Lota lota]
MDRGPACCAANLYTWNPSKRIKTGSSVPKQLPALAGEEERSSTDRLGVSAFATSPPANSRKLHKPPTQLQPGSRIDGAGGRG